MRTIPAGNPKRMMREGPNRRTSTVFKTAIRIQLTAARPSWRATPWRESREKQAVAGGLGSHVPRHRDDGRRAWPYSPAYLGLGRAEALAGDTDKAKKAYQDFHALWKDADPDMPTLIAARREYGALN